MNAPLNMPAVFDRPESPIARAARRYQNTIAVARELRSSRNPKDQAIYVRIRDELVKQCGLERAPGGGLQASGIQPATVHSNQFLTNLSVKYANEMFVGEALVPIVNVSKRSDTFAIYTERDNLATPDQQIGPEGAVPEASQSRTSDNYSVKDYGIKEKISQETLDNQDAVFDEMLDLVEHVNELVSLGHEQRAATFLLSTANYAATQTHVPATKWDHASGGTIVADLLTARAAIRKSPSTRVKMACGIAVWNVIANNPAMRELFKYTRDGLAGVREFMSYFRIDEVHIAEAWQDTANEGQTASISRLWTTDSVVLAAVANAPTRRSAHLASTFQWQGRKQTQWTDPSLGPGSGVIWTKVGVSQDIKGVANKAGYIMTDVLT